MKEIRGVAAVTYARVFNIFFNIDEALLANAEAEMSGRRTSIVDFYELVRERTGVSYNPAEIVPGKIIFDFLINRHGDEWIYVAQEGKDPEAEEKQALRLFHRLLEEPEPVALIDVRYLHRRYSRVRFDDRRFTGFPHDARLNLLFHAALRLARKGMLEAVEDVEPLPAGEMASYGRRRFGILPDVEVSMANVLCDRCRRECGQASLSLHHECARRLSQVLRKAVSSVRNSSDKLGQAE
jgi:hypothetical protein